MEKFKIVCACIAVFFKGTLGLRLANVFQDGMVLQRARESATLYGFEELIPGTEAVLDCSLNGKHLPLQSGIPVSDRTKLGNPGDWMVELPPQEAGTLCDILIIGSEEQVNLNQVLFGDVWLCSGQSNMVFNMNGIFNSTEEIALAAEYTNIRITVILMLVYSAASAISSVELKIPFMLKTIFG